jgi:2-keto-3-deoxy-L-rhamnonate aldolase RhmA
MVSHLRRLLDEQRLIKVCLLGQLCYPKLVEMIAWQGGFDGVWFDQEHVGLTIPQIEDVARAARGCNLDNFVRLNATDYATVMRPLEAGAGGIMASMIRSAAQARDIVSWCRFAPSGMRGVNGTGADGRFGMVRGPAYFRQENERIVVGLQVEHIDAVNEIEAIASIPGVDFLFVGPADLSQSLGLAGEWEHPKVWECITRVAEAAKRHKVAWGILPLSPAYARRCVEMGCRILSLGIDVWFFRKGVAAFQAEYADYFAS